jgi:hypothetical protein
MLLEGERVRAVDHVGTHPPFEGLIAALSKAYVQVAYDDPDAGYGGRTDTYFAGSGWRAWDGEKRWRLQVVRHCAWCEHDISGPGEAMPIMIARLPEVWENWQCTDRGGCELRMRAWDKALEAASAYPPVKYGPYPIAALEAAA